MDEIEVYLQEQCMWEGLEFRNCGNGHFQIIGDYIVNYWPYSKSRTAQIDGEKGLGWQSPADVIQLATESKMSSDDYDNTNSGALFKNDRRTNDRQPHYRGEQNVACPHCGAKTEFWLSSWVKDMKKGGKFMSLALTAKDDPKPPASDGDDFDDDIPF